MASPSKTSDIPVVTPSTAQQAVRECLAAAEAGFNTVPIFLWGAPGVGKSSLVREVADELDVQFIDLRLVQLDPVDLRGLPYVIDAPGEAGHKLMEFAEPGLLPREGRGILFLDELPQAQPLVQNAASELVLDRRIGDYRLPDGWVIIAAGNRRQDRAATQEMPAHLKNRFTHLEINPAFADWETWAQTPKAQGGGEIEPRLIAFLQQNQGRLNAFNPDQVASPTSRTWEFVSHILKTVKDKRARNAMIGGCVGKGMQAEVTAFLSDSDDMPTLEQICNEPDKAPVPDTTSGCRAALDNMATRIDAKFAKQAAIYAKRHLKEVQMVCAVQMIGRKDWAELQKEPAFKAWVDELGLG